MITARRSMSRVLLVSAALILSTIAAAQSVFNGDPVDPSTNAPYTILPGVPLLHSGDDEKFGTNDDLIVPAIIGDVDLVLRSGGTFGGGLIPPPAAGSPAAALVVAGGVHTQVGTEVEFQVVVSDGATTPPYGNALLDNGMDGRGAVVLAYADLDGDGFVGPTNADGSADNAIELQEIQVPVGRQVAAIIGGVASGSLGVNSGAPASGGGLALVLVAGATAGPTPPLYEDGPWIATLLPFMPPLDPTRIIGQGNVLPPDPEGLVEIRLEPEKLYTAVGHPLLGTPYALPTDGSSPTIDLARAVAGAPASVVFARLLDANAFVADPARRVLASVDANSARLLLEEVSAVSLADDGPGNAATVHVQVTDLLGNPTDPGAGGFAVALETGPSLRILSPDADGDPEHEDLLLDQAAPIAVTLDDAGGSGDGAATDRVLAIVGDGPVAALRVTLIGGGVNPTPTPTAGPLPTNTPVASSLSDVRVRMTFRQPAARDLLKLDATVPVATFNPALDAVHVTLSRTGVSLYDRAIAPASFIAKRNGKVFTFQDDPAAPSARIAKAKITSARRFPGQTRLQLKAVALDLPPTTAIDALSLRVEIGGTPAAVTLTCSEKRQGAVLVCAP